MQSDIKVRGEKAVVIRSFHSWKRLHWCRSKVNSAFEIASLMAMFSLIAAAELPLPKEKPNPQLITGFVSTTCLLVATTVMVKVVATSVLPHLDTMAEMSSDEAENAPHDTIINWIFCTCFLGHTIAPILFCVDLILISWIKFPKHAREAPWAVTIIMTPMIVVIGVFGGILYQQMKEFKITEFYPFPNRRYSEIADNWDENDALSSVSVSTDENSQLLQYQYSVTSYGAITQNEYFGSPCTIFADTCL